MTIKNLQINEENIGNLYSKKIVLGEVAGPLSGKASIDKPWLQFYKDEDILTNLPQTTMYNYLWLNNRFHLKDIAIDYYGKLISYGVLFEEIDKTAKAFVALGIKQGDVVSIAMPYLPETVYSIYALNKIGAVVNMVDPRVPNEKLKSYINNSGSHYLVMINKCYPKIESIITDTNLKKVISVSPADSLPLGLKFAKKVSEEIESSKKFEVPIRKNDNYLIWNNFIKLGSKSIFVPSVPYEENSPAIIVYTSGTSGEPKGAVSSNDSFNNMAFFQKASIVNVDRGDKFLLIMPPFIAYGLAIGLHGQLCTGQTLIMVPTFTIENSAELLGKLVKKHRPQTIMGVPNFMVDLINHPAMQNLDCSFLKNVIVGGDSMNPSAEERVNSFLKARQHEILFWDKFMVLQFKVRQDESLVKKGWGLTEVNSCFSYTKNDETNPIGSVGIPLLGNNIKIVKPLSEETQDIDIDTLEELSYGEEGEIFITSPTVIVDYFNNQDESKKVFFMSKKTGKKWIRTMDLGYITEEGFIYISGRMKRIIIRPDGHNVSPFAIEKIINSHRSVENCAVIGRPSELHEQGSYPVAYIQLKEQYKGEEEVILMEVKKEIEDKIPPRDIAADYKFIDEIPLTNIGKVDYKALEEIEKEKVKTLKRK